MSFSRFGELWLAGSHGGGITSGMSYRNWATWHEHSELGAAALCLRRDLRLASLLTHLFLSFFEI